MICAAGIARSVLIVLAVTSLLGCAASPPAPGPPPQAGVDWVTPDLPAGGPAPDSRWWQALDDPLLDALVDAAVADSPTVAQANARINEARALRRSVAAAWRPRLALNGAASRTALSETGGQAGSEILEFGVSQSPANVFEAGFDADWELDLFGRTRMQVRAADARRREAIHQRDAAVLGVIAEVAREYADWRGLGRQQALVETRIRLIERRRRLLAARQSAGLTDRGPLDRIDQSLADARQARNALVAAGAASRHRLALLSGRTPNGFSAWLEQQGAGSRAGRLPDAPLVNAGLPTELLRRRPDLMAAERRLETAAAEAGAAVAALYPRLSLRVGLGRESDRIADLTDPASTVWTLAAGLVWPLFQGGALRAVVDASRARLDQAAAGYRQAVMAALVEAESALAAWVQAESSTRSARAALAAAERSVSQAADRQRAGLVSHDEVLIARLTALRREEDWIAARQHELTRFIATYKALGGGWTHARSRESAFMKDGERIHVAQAE